MARPRKADHDKMVAVTVCFPREFYDACRRVAATRGTSVRRVIRVLAVREFKNFKTASAQRSATLSSHHDF